MEPSQVSHFSKSLGVLKFAVVQLCSAELLALGAGDFFAPDHLDKLIPRGSVHLGTLSLLLCSRKRRATTVHRFTLLGHDGVSMCDLVRRLP